MLPTKPWFSQDQILRLSQLVILVAASVVVVVFLRFHLVTSARAFRQDFERQSFVELSRGETFMVARKLAALGKSDQIECVSATKDGINFFEERNGSCGPGFFRVIENVSEPNHKIEIAFTMKMQDVLVNGLAIFIFIQALLAAFIFLSQRRFIFLKHQHELELASLAQQVAHDLQSPMAILKSLGQSELGKRAFDRLERLVATLQGEEGESLQTSHLYELVEESIQEKISEAMGKVKIINQTSDTLIPGSAFRWRAVLSNLLNNSIEAGATEISVSTDEVDGHTEIYINDNGSGIPADAIKRVGERGFSHGKIHGKGLGVSTAKVFVESMGGQLKLGSGPGKGAEVILSVPKMQSSVVVLIDNDLELAKAWQMAGEKRKVAVVHFPSPTAFLSRTEKFPKSIAIYIDLEFDEPNENGLALGKELNALGFTNLYLCTGRSKSSISKPQWAKDIVGKMPPWL